MIDTREAGAGFYPTPTDLDNEYKTVEVHCVFTTYVSVQVGKYKDPDDEIADINRQVDNMSNADLLEEVDKIIIEDVII